MGAEKVGNGGEFWGMGMKVIAQQEHLLLLAALRFRERESATEISDGGNVQGSWRRNFWNYILRAAHVKVWVRRVEFQNVEVSENVLIPFSAPSQAVRPRVAQ
jgi:hypothetical protein